MLGLGSGIAHLAAVSEEVYTNTHSLVLDGVGDYFDTNTNMNDIIRCTSTPGFTFGTWVRLGDTSSLQVIFGSVNSPYQAGQFLIYFSTTALAFIIRAQMDSYSNKNCSLSLSSVAAANEWHWIGVTADVSGLAGDSSNVPMVLYHADGVSGTITTTSGSTMPLQALNNYVTSNDMDIGKYLTTYHLNGQFDQTCVWNKALSASEIEALVANPNNDYNQDFGNYAGSSNLVHYYKMDNNTTDSGSGGSDGTLNNDATFTTSNIPIS
jgi:hypothetical protein